MNAWNPQPATGTDWTTVGSHDDSVVQEWSAAFMGAHQRFNYDNEGFGHPELLQNWGGCPCEGWHSHNGATPWKQTWTIPQPSELIDRQLTFK